MTHALSTFLISMALWHLTWGWTHIIINSVITTILFKLIAKLRILNALLWSLLSHITVSGLFLLAITGIFNYLSNYQVNSDTYFYLQVYNTPLRCALFFGAWYALLQTIFFVAIERFYVVPLTRIIIALLLSNFMSAYMTYIHMRL